MSAEKHILSFIWFAGNKSVLRDVSERFGVGEVTLFRMLERVIRFLLELAKEIIKFPKSEVEKAAAAESFLKISGFPMVIGCIDGTSIPIRTPVHEIKCTYVNRHDLPSLTLQGICNSNKQFIDVFTGPPGKIHDSRVFKMSFISQEIEKNCVGTYHLLGDSAYGIWEYLLTPYRDYGTLGDSEKNYNKIFSGTRVLIENTFGLLKNRFRQLLKLEFHDVDKSTSFIIGCCVLHNICIKNNDFIDIDDNVILDSEAEFVTSEEEISKLKGETKRELIKTFLENRRQ